MNSLWTRQIISLQIIKLGFEMRALHSLGRCSTSWVTPPAPLLWLFWIGSCFLPSLDFDPPILYFLLSLRWQIYDTIPRFFLLWWGLKLFLPGWTWTAVLPISLPHSWDDRCKMTSVCPCAQLRWGSPELLPELASNCDPLSLSHPNS
jgi:hypothetical protein